MKALFRKCPLRCPCLCHDTQGGIHDHPGRPCPGKFLTAEERTQLNRGSMSTDGEGRDG